MRLATAILNVDKKEAMATRAACLPVDPGDERPQQQQATLPLNIETRVCSVNETSSDVNSSAQMGHSLHTLPCHVGETSMSSGNALQCCTLAVSAIQPVSGSSASTSASVNSGSLGLSLLNTGLVSHRVKTVSTKQNSSEKLQRSRERNRIHARKTRQRKKEQMLTLQSRAEELKQEQIRLKQSINEKNTASILVGLFSTSTEKENSKQNEDPKVELLLRRPAEDIPDASKITELPALILPGQHNSKKTKTDSCLVSKEVPNDGIDYELLGKDRSKCTPEELDRIRRERNRMHAKRTRDRKRLFMEEMAEMCKQLEEENSILRTHLESLDIRISPDLDPSLSPPSPLPQATPKSSDELKCISVTPDTEPAKPLSRNGVTFDQIKTLLEAAGSFDCPRPSMSGMMSLSSVATSVAAATLPTVSANASSSGASVSDDHDDSSNDYGQSGSASKRPRLGDSRTTVTTPAVPKSISAPATAVGC